MSHRAQTYVHWILCDVSLYVHVHTVLFVESLQLNMYIKMDGQGYRVLVGSPGFNCWILLQRFSVGLAVEYSSCFISIMDIDLYVCCFDSLVS